MIVSLALMEKKYFRHKGFTLIEAMIVVAILAVVAAVAIPSYQQYIKKGRRADAKAALLDAANRQEQFILNRATYTANMASGGLGYSSDPAPSPDGYYSFDATLSLCGASNALPCRGYTLTATPIVGKGQDKDTACTVFSLSSTGAKTASGTLGNECWK